jgi:hypothetical protein
MGTEVIQGSLLVALVLVLLGPEVLFVTIIFIAVLTSVSPN